MLNLAQTLVSSRRHLERIDSEDNDREVIIGRNEAGHYVPELSSASESDEDEDEDEDESSEKRSTASASFHHVSSTATNIINNRLVRLARETETQTSTTSLNRFASKSSLHQMKMNDGSVVNLHRLVVDHHYAPSRRVSQSQVSKLSFDCTPYSTRHIRRVSKRERPSVVEQHFRRPSVETWSPHRTDRGSISITQDKDRVVDADFGPEGNAVYERKVYLPKVVRLTMTTSALLCVLIVYCLACTFIMQTLEEDSVVISMAKDATSCSSGADKDKAINRSTVVIDLIVSDLLRLSHETGNSSRPLQQQQLSLLAIREALLNNTQLINAIEGYVNLTVNGNGNGDSGCEPSETATVAEKWNFNKAAMFVMTVVTTIGYGHIAPKSIGGRVATIIIAIFGIPLLVVGVAELAALFTHSVKLLIRIARHCGRSRVMKEGKRRRFSSAVILQIWMALLLIPAYIFITAVLYQQLEGWSYFDSVYFTFITYSTIGFGDMTPAPDKSEVATIYGNLLILLGVGLYAMLIQTIGVKYMRVQRAIHRCVKRFDQNLLKHTRASVKRHTVKLFKEPRRDGAEIANA